MPKPIDLNDPLTGIFIIIILALLLADSSLSIYVINTHANLLEHLQISHFGIKKRTQGGISTSNLVMSAYTDGNENVFPHVLNLHVPKGSKVADVT
nr:hypothetical protein [Vibrio cholerae]